MNIIRENNVVVQVQIIQSMSILIQNMSNETAVYYLLSNNHINDIIVYGFDFSHEELRDWYACRPALFCAWLHCQVPLVFSRAALTGTRCVVLFSWSALTVLHAGSRRS